MGHHHHHSYQGFTDTQSRRAVAAVHASSLDAAVDWIVDHPEDDSAMMTANFGSVAQPTLAPAPVSVQAPAPAPVQAPVPNVPASSSEVNADDDEMVVEPASTVEPCAAQTVATTVSEDVHTIMRCNECGATFEMSDENGIARHSASKGHTDFCETMGSKDMKDTRTMTEEEKKAEIARVNELLRKRREERAEQEKQSQVLSEKARREQGKMKQRTKEEYEDLKKKIDRDQAAKEKREDKAYIARVRAQIEADKRERQSKTSTDAAVPVAGQPTPAPAPAPVSQPQTLPASNEAPTEISVRVRLPNGSETMVFKPNATIHDLERSIYNKVGHGNFSISTQFPRRKFIASDRNMTLIDAQLHPRGSVIVELNQSELEMGGSNLSRQPQPPAARPRRNYMLPSYDDDS